MNIPHSMSKLWEDLLTSLDDTLSCSPDKKARGSDGKAALEKKKGAQASGMAALASLPPAQSLAVDLGPSSWIGRVQRIIAGRSQVEQVVVHTICSGTGAPVIGLKA